MVNGNVQSVQEETEQQNDEANIDAEYEDPFWGSQEDNVRLDSVWEKTMRIQATPIL